MFRSYNQSCPRKSTFLQSSRGGCSRQDGSASSVGVWKATVLGYIELRNLIVKQLPRLSVVQSGIANRTGNVNLFTLRVAQMCYGQPSYTHITGSNRGHKKMRSSNCISLLLVLAGVSGLATATNAQDAIGKATSVRPQAEGIHSGSTRTLSGGADVYSKETVRTGDSGQADLRFQDNSNLNVGPKSSVRLDKFVYDPNKSAGTVAVQATRGSFRFVTGSQGGGTYQIKTPYGTLGVRG
jgi:hypothetical protein